MKTLTPKTHSAIIYDKKCRQSYRTIAKQLEYSKSTIHDIFKNFQQTGSSISKKRAGRSPLLNTPSQQELKAFVQENGENRRLCSKKLATV